MSVTFASAISDDTARVFRLTCEVQGFLGEWTGHENAYGEANAHSLVCTDHLCQGYGASIDEVTPDLIEINMANRNAVRVLLALGYITDADLAADDAPTFAGIPMVGVDLSGHDSADSFLGRVLMALALSPTDEGMPTNQIASNVTAFGWASGDLQNRLTALHQLAVQCAAQGSAVTWA